MEKKTHENTTTQLLISNLLISSHINYFVSCLVLLIPSTFFVDCAVDNAAIDKNEDLSEETKEWLKTIKDSSTTVVAVLGVEEFIKGVENPPSDEDFKTDLIDLGWKKTGDGFEDWTENKVKKISHKISPS